MLNKENKINTPNIRHQKNSLIFTKKFSFQSNQNLLQKIVSISKTNQKIFLEIKDQYEVVQSIGEGNFANIFLANMKSQN